MEIRLAPTSKAICTLCGYPIHVETVRVTIKYHGYRFPNTTHYHAECILNEVEMSARLLSTDIKE